MKKVLILTADGFEDSELLVPYETMRKEGFEADIASTHKGTITGKHGHRIGVDKTLEEVDPEAYDALILPGGRAPEKLRTDKRALEIVRRFVDDGKIVAAICHGPQLLISAGRIAGRHATGYRKIARELREDSAVYEDREVVVDGNLITSRVPADLDAFVGKILQRLKRGKEE